MDQLQTLDSHATLSATTAADDIAIEMLPLSSEELQTPGKLCKREEVSTPPAGAGAIQVIGK